MPGRLLRDTLTGVRPGGEWASPGSSDQATFTPRACNRRGTLPTIAPPPHWLRDTASAAALGTALFLEPLGKSREGYYLPQQDSGLPGGHVLRVVSASPSPQRTRFVFWDRHSTPTSSSLARAGSKWACLGKPLPFGTDAVSVKSEKPLALRSVSIVPADERVFQARFLGAPGKGRRIRLLVRSGPGDATVLDETLEEGRARLDFRLPEAGRYSVTGYLAGENAPPRRLNTLTLTVR